MLLPAHEQRQREVVVATRACTSHVSGAAIALLVPLVRYGICWYTEHSTPVRSKRVFKSVLWFVEEQHTDLGNTQNPTPQADTVYGKSKVEPARPACGLRRCAARYFTHAIFFLRVASGGAYLGSSQGVPTTETAVPTDNGQATGGLKGCSGCSASVRQAQSETR